MFVMEGGIAAVLAFITWAILTLIGVKMNAFDSVGLATILFVLYYFATIIVVHAMWSHSYRKPPNEEPPAA
ncbi:MAG: hypothetical protein JWM52_796 [Candidatus Saccharibacteria bacterium]|nr:hypothetical protein [Candidatus Saccharibacteria bacterium]